MNGTLKHTNIWNGLALLSRCFNSNIISANKNNTAIAPTYTIRKRKAKNSQFRINNKIEEAIKQTIKLTIDWIEFLREITKIEDNVSKKENRWKNPFMNIYVNNERESWTLGI